MPIEYSNPRRFAQFRDWPSGHTRTTCTFEIEKNTQGERAKRTTINPKTGKLNAPKVLTYSARQLIVDGSDGKTYIMTKSVYGHINVMQSNMELQEEAIFMDNPRYATVNALFVMVP